MLFGWPSKVHCCGGGGGSGRTWFWGDILWAHDRGGGPPDRLGGGGLGSPAATEFSWADSLVMDDRGEQGGLG